MVERRLFTRLKHTFKIRWKDRDLDFVGVTADLCPGGVFIVTEMLPPLHTLLEMEIRLNRELPVRCRGEVVWANRGQVDSYPPGFGVRFIDLSDDVLAVLLMVCGDHHGAVGLYGGLG